MPSPDDDLSRERESILDQIYETGDAYRRRRARTWGAAAVGVLALLIAVPLVAAQNDDARVASLGDGGASSTTTDGETSTTATTLEPTTTSSAAVDGSPGSDSSVVPDPSTTTTAGEPCRDSYDEACGPFRWDPAPGANRPATVTIVTQQAGAAVHFTVTWSDPDSPIRPLCPLADFGDGSYGDIPCAEMACAEHPPGYGPWTPPDPERGTHTFELDHTYATQGAFTFTFRGEAEGCGPYGSNAEASKVVNVAA